MSARALHLDFPRGGARVAFWPVAVAAGTAVLSAAAAVILGPAALALPFGLALVAVLVRYPPALLVIYGYVGIFKGEPLVADLPFDVTLVLGVLLALVCLHRLIEGRVRPVPAAYLALLLLIGCTLAVSLTWTPMADYGTEKVLKFFSFTAVAALAPFFIIEDRRDLMQLLWATVGLAILSAGVALAFPGARGAERAARVRGQREHDLHLAPALRRARSSFSWRPASACRARCGCLRRWWASGSPLWPAASARAARSSASRWRSFASLWRRS